MNDTVNDAAPWDCLIVGGGPAGLTAGVYLARYHRRVAIIDAQTSRARYIPQSHNCPGFAWGISGTALLERLRTQAQEFGASIIVDQVIGITRAADGFVVASQRRSWRARSVLLATGIVDVLPDMPDVEGAIAARVVRLCPICDAFEATDESIVVYGPASTAISHARFLRTYSNRVSVALSSAEIPSDSDCASARELGIDIIPFPNEMITEESRCVIVCAGQRHAFDCVYPILGWRPTTGPVAALNLRLTDSGAIDVTEHLETSVAGLYVAGDVISLLHQVSVANGQAAVAATAIHNWLPLAPR